MKTYELTVDGIGPVPVTVDDRGDGPAFLLLHGGAGPQSVTGFGELLAEAEHARVVVPIHPGFGGTHRPERLTSIRGLAALYVALLDELDLTDVTVIGSSIGGWIAAEVAALGSARVGGLVLVCAVGIELPGRPVVDFFTLTPDQVTELSYHNPDRFRIDPAAMSDEQRAVLAGNRTALAVYGGTAMADPTLAGRLAGITVPALVIAGASDRIAEPDRGRAFADAIPNARFELLPDTGHLPQLETPDQLLRAVAGFAVAGK